MTTRYTKIKSIPQALEAALFACLLARTKTMRSEAAQIVAELLPLCSVKQITTATERATRAAGYKEKAPQ